ncbi:MAG: NYN domain-containing protein, partial [Aggregatilineales bacterium]
EFDGICIASSDSDYTPLATRIREKNLFVMGIGRKTTPRAFVDACDVFVYTENLRSNVEDKSADTPLPTSKLEGESVPIADHFEKLFRRAFDATVQDDGWAHLGTLGSSLRQLDPGFDPRTYGYKLLSQLVQDNPDFFKIQKRETKSGNADIYIRLKN